MAVRQNPRSGISYGWPAGDSGWVGRVNIHLMRASHQAPNYAVIDTLSTPPTTGLADGNIYIVGASPTGDWSTYLANTLALYGYLEPDFDNLGWVNLPVFAAWTCWHIANNQMLVYDGTAWRVVYTYVP